MTSQLPGLRWGRVAFLAAYRGVYAGLLRPILFMRPAQDAHQQMLDWLRWADRLPGLAAFLGTMRCLAFESSPTLVGGVRLEFPLILAAGLVKGEGFETETAALAAVEHGENIIPGWRCLPRLVGLVEFGSFTRWPRLGNPGTVVWRDRPTCSTQNRVGLRNPGATAAAAFLAARRDQLPAQFGLNIATSPGVDDTTLQAQEVRESLACFVERGVVPSWFTLNLSCPNTEDDPEFNQTTEGTRQVCDAAVSYLRGAGQDVPLWVKLGPTLADEQYRLLMQVLAETGVRAVIATNTLPLPTPGQPLLMAGAGGGRLHRRAVEVAAVLVHERQARGYPVEVIGCGGIENGATYRNFARLGIHAAQYWSALVYRGPLAAALIVQEGRQKLHDNG